jgi:heptosyltransferase-2
VIRDAPRRVLVRLPNWVGDAVMATPALRALRRAVPGAHVTLEGRPFLAGLVRGLASMDEFLPSAGKGLGAALRRAGELRARAFDCAVLLPDSLSSALGPFLARVPVRAGYAREPLRRALLTLRLDVPSENGVRVPIPMVERYLRITRALGCADAGLDMELAVDPHARRSIDERLAVAGVRAGERVLLVTPGASFGSSKLWPPEHFAEAAERIGAEHGLRTVIAPGPGEEEIAREVALHSDDALVLADPVTTLEELKALVQRSRLVLANDTGPRAIAVALGIPVVVLMGPTDPRHTALHLERQRVLREDVECSPCHEKICPIDHRCMTRLSPERAVAAARELLG